MKFYSWLVILISLSANAQKVPVSTTYGVGFRTLYLYDTARSFDTTRTDSLRFRPVKIDLFYPATSQSSKTRLPFQFFLDLYGKRIDFHTPPDSCRKLGRELATYYSNGLGLPSAGLLAKLPTHSYQLAPVAQGSFPLVLYCPAYNGMSYENITLLEQLVRQGYWVASVSSVGKYPGFMTMDPVDIIEQVEDARFARRYLQRTIPALSDRVAMLGYSWGGLAASIVAMHEADIRAVVSLDGSERYTYGDNEADDGQFTQIRQQPYFKPAALRVPYLYLSSGRETDDFRPDSVYVLASATSSTTSRYLRFPATSHDNFSCLPYLASQVKLSSSPRGTYTTLANLVVNWLDTHVKNAEDRFQKNVQRLLQQKSPQLTLDPPTPTPSDRVSFSLQGLVTDLNDKPLPYANIGILKGNQGTVSGENGSFTWRSSGANRADTVRVSMVGYEHQDWPLAQLIQRAANGPLRFKLKRQSLLLSEVVVKTRRAVRQVVGNATESRFFSVGFSSEQAGAQMGIRVRASKTPTYIEKVDFHISYNRYDSLTIRLTVYQLENGVPTHNLMSRPVLVRLGRQTGRVAFDLGAQPIAITNDVLVALELLDGQGGPDRGLYLSAGMLNGSTYHRRASQGAWRQSKGIGAGIQVTVQH